METSSGNIKKSTKGSPKTNEKPKKELPNDLLCGDIDISLRLRIERNILKTHTVNTKYTPSLGIKDSRSRIHAAIDKLLDGIE